MTDSPEMYKVQAGYAYKITFRSDPFDTVTEAMDYADSLYDEHGFFYSEVLDSNGKLQYFVEEHTPRTPSEYEARKIRAQRFALDWFKEKANSKQNSDSDFK